MYHHDGWNVVVSEKVYNLFTKVVKDWLNDCGEKHPELIKSVDALKSMLYQKDPDYTTMKNLKTPLLVYYKLNASGVIQSLMNDKSLKEQVELCQYVFDRRVRKLLQHNGY